MQLVEVEEGFCQRLVSRIETQINSAARLLKNLITDIQQVYGDAQAEFVRSLIRFDRSLQGAGLLVLKRVDDKVGTLLSARESSSPAWRLLSNIFRG